MVFFQPSILSGTPYLLSTILKHEKQCDLSCVDFFGVGGEKVHKELLLQLKARVGKDAKVRHRYGTTETGLIFSANVDDAPFGSLGANCSLNQIKLVEPTTGAAVTEPYEHGELWIRGPGCFTKYHNNPEETAQVITDDGWVKTGDIFYHDEQQNFYFVDRLKLVIYCRNMWIIPTELEEVITGHPGILEVCVVGVPHPEDGEQPVACVVRRPGHDVTAQEIKNLVAEKLSEGKQLRGGVTFMEELPKTPTGKVARMGIKELMRCLEKE